MEMSVLYDKHPDKTDKTDSIFSVSSYKNYLIEKVSHELRNLWTFLQHCFMNRKLKQGLKREATNIYLEEVWESCCLLDQYYFFGKALRFYKIVT